MREPEWLIGVVLLMIASYGNAADVPSKVDKTRAIVSVGLKCFFTILVFFIFRNIDIKTVVFFLLAGIEAFVYLAEFIIIP